jgi:hypothetical protein
VNVGTDAQRRARIREYVAPLAADQRVLPHSLEAERAVLGAVLLHNDALSPATEIVGPGDFFRDAHRRIFDKMLKLGERNEAVDFITLKESLARSGDLDDVGGPAYIAALIDGVPHSTNVEHYARIIKEKATLRNLIFSANKMLASAYGGANSVDVVVHEAQCAMQFLADSAVSAAGDVSQPLTAAIERFSEATQRDLVLGDLLALGEIAMFHGQPRDGKTWASLEVAIAVALGDKAFGLARLTAPAVRGVLIVSNEDGERAVVGRLQLLLAGRGVWAAPSNFHLIVGQGCDLDTQVWRRRLIHEVRRLGVGLVILDPIRSLTGCVDQGPHELQPFALYLRTLLRETGVSVLLVHHDAKPAAGVTDNRRRAQRASGGAIFSIVDAPMHVERIDEHRSLLAPDGFKFCADPESFVFERVRAADGQALRLVAADSGSANDAAEVVMQAKLEAFLRDNPGRSGRDIARGVKVHRQTVSDALERMFKAGVVDAVDGARKARLWTLRG